MAVTVLLVDDVIELRGVICQALRLRGGFDVVAEAADGVSAVAAAAEHQPDVIVLDLGLPDLAGHEVVTRVREVAPHAQVVVFTGSVSADRMDIVEQVTAFVRKEQDVAYLVDLLADLSRDRHHAASMQLGPDLGDVRRARQFVTESCEQWGCTAAVDDAMVVVAELVTNALVHAGPRCELRLGFAGDVLRFEVEDAGTGAPDVQAADATSEHGRGLLLVSALCIAWGVETGDRGSKVVWAELLVPSRSPASGDGDDRRPEDGGGPRLLREPHGERSDAERRDAAPSGRHAGKRAVASARCSSRNAAASSATGPAWSSASAAALQPSTSSDDANKLS